MSKSASGVSVGPVRIYTDGACKGNPGPGGWGAVLRMDGEERELFGGEPQTTNNRMELTAVIRALGALKPPCRIEVYTDSQYVQKGISEWHRLALGQRALRASGKRACRCACAPRR